MKQNGGEEGGASLRLKRGDVWEDNSFDVATLFFCLHEMPRGARMRVLSNACRISRHAVYIMDISTRSTFSEAMISGEPYLLEYQTNILEDLSYFNSKVHSVVDDRILFSEIFCDSNKYSTPFMKK